MQKWKSPKSIKMNSGFRFFKCISTSQEMVIPRAVISEMPPANRVMLRDRYGNRWPVKVDRDEWSFKKGWPCFYEENCLEQHDFLFFEYKGGCLFDVKILGHNACEKKGAPNFITRDDDDDEDDEVDGDDDEEEDEDDENVQEEQVRSNNHPFFVSRSRGSRMNELLIPQHVLKHYKLKLPKTLSLVDVRGNKWQTQVKKRSDGRQLCVGGLKSLCVANNIDRYDTCICDLILEGRQDPCIRVRVVDAAGTSRNASRLDKRRSYRKRVNDYYGTDIFRQGRAIRPKDCPFFVSRSRPRRHEIMIPKEVIVDYKLKLPEALFLVDERERSWETKVKRWKDRVVCGGGWRSLCNVNNIQENDACICEFYLQPRHPYILVRRI